ncbi:translation initiation factor Sui1 [Candidatus Accumulibacter sp. ACC007]|uniref:translation initiation factor Sui1 n=1 Tax=Candidatus Accumulibacter sp. ACC007 TaxID=2823333 RepID=UPI0025BD03A9|nr:translation initiation factor Sui1 [Candidatus Accumulibacter sp. ACC007]
MRKPAAGGLVYSTDAGRMCPSCRRPLAGCVCAATQAPSPGQGDGGVRVSRESKGRGGKTVTLVRGLMLDAGDLAALAKRLKAACGAGGTVKDGVVEVQGDHCDRLLEHLRKEGFAAKRAGG